MDKFENCGHICQESEHRENRLCCNCGKPIKDPFCESCDSRRLESQKYLAERERFGNTVINSGIHYWYKLKYEFSILRYIKNYQSDFNKHDKKTFSTIEHDETFILFARNSGTHMLLLNRCVWNIKRFQIAHVNPLLFRLSEYLKYNYLYYYGHKGKINLLDRDTLLNTFETWLKDNELWTQQLSQQLDKIKYRIW